MSFPFYAINCFIFEFIQKHQFESGLLIKIHFKESGIKAIGKSFVFVSFGVWMKTIDCVNDTASSVFWQ